MNVNVNKEKNLVKACLEKIIWIFNSKKILLNISFFVFLETNPCENSPCQHQSICITKPNHDVQCICRPHYTGKYCEKPRMYPDFI